MNNLERVAVDVDPLFSPPTVMSSASSSSSASPITTTSESNTTSKRESKAVQPKFVPSQVAFDDDDDANAEAEVDVVASLLASATKSTLSSYSFPVHLFFRPLNRDTSQH